MSGHVRFMTPRSLDWFAHVAAISALVLEACSRHHGDSQLEQAARAVEQTNTPPDALFDSVRLAVQPDLMSNERLSATRAISSARPHPAPRCATEEGRAAATQEESRRDCERDEPAEPNITTWFVSITAQLPPETANTPVSVYGCCMDALRAEWTRHSGGATPAVWGDPCIGSTPEDCLCGDGPLCLGSPAMHLCQPAAVRAQTIWCGLLVRPL